MSADALFTVIIPAFNKWALTEACLRSLKEHGGVPFDVIVADNASSDETAGELDPLGAALFGERFRSIRFAENRNFGPACNAAAAAAKTDLLFFLNNDTLVTPGWERPLLEALADDERLAGVGPLLLYENDTVQHLGVAFTALGVMHLYRGMSASHPLAGKRRKFQAITAAAFMLPKALFFEHKGFYEGFRNGFEDVDLCLRIHATGKKFSCIPESRVYHLESQTPGRNKWESANSVLLWERSWPLAQTDLHLLGSADGLAPFVDDCLRIALRLSEQEEKALAKEAEGKDWAFRYELMEANPLWAGGRLEMALALEEMGKYGEAVVPRYQLAFILESEQAYKNLLRTAVRGGVEEYQQYAETNLKNILRYKASKEQSFTLVKQVLGKASRYGDKELAQMYLEKMKAWFPDAELKI